MQCWKITQTYSNTQESEWSHLTDLTLGKAVHPGRRLGFILSREALRQNLEAVGETPAVEDLILKDYHSLEKWPQYTISLSHTKNAGAALIANRANFLSVGIDVELADRVVSEAVVNRMAHPKDLNLRKLYLWSIKEAAYKCLMNSQKGISAFEFRDFCITKDSWLHVPSNLQGTWELHSPTPFVVALAFLKA